MPDASKPMEALAPIHEPESNWPWPAAFPWVLPLKPSSHPLLGMRRVNPTFRKVG